MRNDSKPLEDLPCGLNTYLSIPHVDDTHDFLTAVKDSIKLHHPWVEAPNGEDKYLRYIERINGKSQMGFFIKRLEDHQLVGVININEIVMGVFQSGYLGFYAFNKYSGQGLMSEGLSLVLGYYFNTLRLHRLEANIQPENEKSIHLIKRKKFRQEGFSLAYLKINGKWRDHARYAMTLEDYRESA
jgi:[ribosomal protein S5]-alanine N-acetyltransferase